MEVEETGVFSAKTHLSELINRVEKEGVTFRITKRGKPVAELKPIRDPAEKFRQPFGYAKGSVLYMAPDFDEPLEELQEYM